LWWLPDWARRWSVGSVFYLPQIHVIGLDDPIGSNDDPSERRAKKNAGETQAWSAAEKVACPKPRPKEQEHAAAEIDA
jgi:hypothetical protein